MESLVPPNCPKNDDLYISIVMLSMRGHPLPLLSDNQIHEATKAADIAVEFSAFLQHRL